MNSGITYVKEMMEITDYHKFDVEKLVDIYYQSVKDREENIITFRDVSLFQSIHTGQWSCKGKKSWLEMVDVEPKNPKSKELLNSFFEF